MLNNPAYLEKVLTEFRIKRAALSSLRTFLLKCHPLLNTQLWKLITTFLVNAVTFFINHDKDKKDVIAIFKQYIPDEEYRLVKSDLFECILQIPSTNGYVSKYVHILHSVCEEIVSEEIQSVPKSLIRKIIHNEDHYLGELVRG